jgi:hypothetical protein
MSTRIPLDCYLWVDWVVCIGVSLWKEADWVGLFIAQFPGLATKLERISTCFTILSTNFDSLSTDFHHISTGIPPNINLTRSFLRPIYKKITPLDKAPSRFSDRKLDVDQKTIRLLLLGGLGGLYEGFHYGKRLIGLACSLTSSRA